jgi:hypothetical protein
MTDMISVDVQIIDDSTFVLSSCRSEDLPLYSESGWDGVLVLSRENSEKLVLSRDNSNSLVFSRENSQSGKDLFDKILLSRENSTSIADDTAILGRENSGLLLTRENSGFLGSLARETSADLCHILCGPSDAVEIPALLGSSDKTGMALGKDMNPAVRPAQRDADGMDLDEPCVLDSQVNAQGRALRSRGAPAPRESRRGAHVKERPEMQKTARDGAAHWAESVRAIRTAWTARANLRPAFRSQFAGQVDAAHGRIKSKQECLLRFLQMAADDGVVTPGPFAAGGFFGWHRFEVAGGRAGEFRRGLEGLFPAGFREDTLKETFRRAGLIPDRWQWEQGWRGGVPFEFRAKA